jgi:hypothetical protein
MTLGHKDETAFVTSISSMIKENKKRVMGIMCEFDPSYVLSPSVTTEGISVKFGSDVKITSC